MRFFVTLTLALAFVSLCASADTYVSGPVAGTWTLALSPYVVTGEINVPGTQVLTIEPGVQVKFAGNFRFSVYGRLSAVGSESSPIVFTHLDPQPTSVWRGVRFFSSEGLSELGYCTIEWGYAQGLVGNPDSRGGGIYVESSSVHVHHCNIRNNKADVKGGGLAVLNRFVEAEFNTFTLNLCNSDGGGIFLDNSSSSLIHDNYIFRNSAMNGGGLHCQTSSPQIYANDFNSNEAYSAYGGAIMMDHSSPEIHHNHIYVNFSQGTYGGGVFCSGYSSPLIHHNDISSNNSGISCLDHSSPTIDNNTLVANGNSAIWASLSSHPVGRNNILWDNIFGIMLETGCTVTLTYCDIEAGWPGIGNFSLPPAFVSLSDYHLMPYSPCIDHGAPATPLDPDSTIADVGCFYFDQNQPQGICSISTTPLGAPIVLPPSGGTVLFTVLILNSPDFYNIFDVWLTMQQPDSQIVPLISRYNLYLPASGNIARTVSLAISAAAPPGTYTVRAYVGDNPFNIEDFDSFTFVKSPSGEISGSEPATATITDGDLTQTVLLSTTPLPQETKLLGNYPDPFNPTTDIRYKIQEARNVSLRVYDTAGRLVNTLVDGYREAGEHVVTFDGSQLSSGLYFLRMQAGDYTSVKKMTLLK